MLSIKVWSLQKCNRSMFIFKVIIVNILTLCNIMATNTIIVKWEVDMETAAPIAIPSADVKKQKIDLHHNFFILTKLLGSKAKPVLAKQLCCILTKMYRLYKWSFFFYIIYTFFVWTINGHLSIYTIHFCLYTTLLGSNFKPSCNRNCLIKRFQCFQANNIFITFHKSLHS